jgi:hypothetical protein
MTMIEEMRRDLERDRNVVLKMKEIEERPQMARVLAQIDGYDFKGKLVEFVAVMHSIVQSVIERNEEKWRIGGATFLIFLKRWPELYGVADVPIGKHGPN